MLGSKKTCFASWSQNLKEAVKPFFQAKPPLAGPRNEQRNCHLLDKQKGKARYQWLLG
jgi:hypothetical protein